MYTDCRCVFAKENNRKYAKFDTDIWEVVPMVDQGILDNGYKGGEGQNFTGDYVYYGNYFQSDIN